MESNPGLTHASNLARIGSPTIPLPPRTPIRPGEASPAVWLATRPDDVQQLNDKSDCEKEGCRANEESVLSPVNTWQQH